PPRHPASWWPRCPAARPRACPASRRGSSGDPTASFLLRISARNHFACGHARPDETRTSPFVGNRQALAALGPAALEDLTPILSCHPEDSSVGLFAAAVVRLKSTLALGH